eukprot:6852139-Lingulodinium_polyedra.AAC.1
MARVLKHSELNIQVLPKVSSKEEVMIINPVSGETTEAVAGSSIVYTETGWGRLVRGAEWVWLKTKL